MHDSCAAPCLVSRESSEISIKVASSREERYGAFRLAYIAYHRAGLCGARDEGLRITPYQLLTTTDVIVANLRGETISTLSLVRDGSLGLPLEAIYPEEVRQRRAAAVRLAEVSCLADRRQDSGRFFGLFSELARIMIQMADRERVDQLLIAVHPRHARMYCRVMAFKQVGADREYPAVNGNPAVLLCLDLAEVKSQRSEIWQRFVGEPLPEALVQPQPIDAFDRQYFERLVQSLAIADDRCVETPLVTPEVTAPALTCA